MALTYTEIEQEKSIRIWTFFLVVLVFYFLIAAILGNLAKVFFAPHSEAAGKANLFLSQKEFLYILLFALCAAVIHAAYSVSSAMPLIRRNLGAQDVDMSDKYHERFKKIVDEVNVAAGNKYNITPIVIPTTAMNAFAISDNRKNAVIGVTEGLLSKLNRQQLEAVIAHECGHIVSGDSFQTTVGCALFGIYAAMLAGIGKILRGGRIRSGGRPGGGSVILFLLIVYFVLNIMQFFYNLIRLFVSRDRELRADAIAVKLTRDPISLSEALYAISRGWRGLGCIDRNLESLFIINPAREPVDEAEGFLPDLLSTHPPVSKRIAILAAMAHVDVKNIQEDIIAEEKLREASRQIVGDETLRPIIINDETMPLSSSAFNCPKCRQPLTDEEYEGAVVRRCIFCGGVLVESERLGRIIIRKEKGFTGRIKKMAALTQEDGLRRMRNKVKTEPVSPASYLKCPKCGQDMVRNFYTVVYLVEVDRCDMCNLIWFDRNELEVLQYLIENKKTEA